MKYLLTSEEMRNIDCMTSSSIGVSSEVLMERAALACAEAIKQSGFDTSKILIVCGTGNNGADGLALARIIHRFYNTEVYLAESYGALRGLVKAEYDSAARSRVRFISDPDFREYTIIVDALFGIGISRDIDGKLAELIEMINDSYARIISVDMPSGICADSGKIYAHAVKADLTVTFAYAKRGQLLYPGADYCGRLLVRDIGIYADLCGKCDRFVYTYNEKDLSMIPERRRYSNKGSYGRVLVIAGSENMSGAALLAAGAAYKSGCGLVEVFTDSKIADTVRRALPEAIVTVYESGAAPDYDKLAAAINSASAVVIGPGLSKSQTAKALLTYTLEASNIPTVVDADALNIIAETPELIPYLKSRIVTPHLGEMARLTGKSIAELSGSVIGSAEEYARATGAICVLKDARTAVAAVGEATFLNTAGNSGMAKGGSGDTLAGIIASLASQGIDPSDAARIGVYLHALGGDRAAARLGEYSMLAHDIADEVGKLMSEISKN